MQLADPPAPAEPASPKPAPAEPASPEPAPAPGRWQRIGSAVRGLFPVAEPRPVTRWMVAGAALAVVAGTAVSLFRTAGTGPFQSIWEEDARDILNDALGLSSYEAVTKPPPGVGYYTIGPRLLGELATVFPLPWAAAVLSVSSAVICALFALAVYVASGAHLRHPLARLLVSAPMLFAPSAENWLSEIYNRPVCVHFFGLYAIFWMLLWTPTSRAGRLAALGVVAFTAFSTIVAVFFIPLAVLRLAVRRDRLGAAMLAMLLVAGALNAQLLSGSGGRGDVSAFRLNPIWAVGYYIIWAVPNSMLGFRATEDLAYLPGKVAEVGSRNAVVIGLSWLLIAVVVAAAFVGVRRGLLRPAWALALLAAAHSAGLLCFMIMANGGIAQRYVMPVEMLLFAALVALLRPVVGAGVDYRKAGALLAAFAVFVVAISVPNYRWTDTYRAQAPRWTAQIAEAKARCKADPNLATVVVRGGPQPFWSIVLVPCHEIDQPVHCPSASCVWIDPPKPVGLGRRP